MQDELPIGTMLVLNAVSYKVEKKLGEGHFGQVYMVQQVSRSSMH